MPCPGAIRALGARERAGTALCKGKSNAIRGLPQEKVERCV